MTNFGLIDWRMVGFGAVWILGLAVVLSAMGFADFRAGVHGSRFRDEIRRPLCRTAIDLGLALFSVGMAGSGRLGWETIIWTLLAAGFLYSAVRGLSYHRKANP